MARETKEVKAKKVRVGDFIPGLDDAYVPEEPERDPYFSVGGYSASSEGMVGITMHDANGNELYLFCDKNMPITVRRDS